jgi:hypothetical protein
MKKKAKYFECDKCHKQGESIHGCPYAEEIHNDYKARCNCCRKCQYDCAMDI